MGCVIGAIVLILVVFVVLPEATKSQVIEYRPLACPKPKCPQPKCICNCPEEPKDCDPFDFDCSRELDG